MADDAITDDAQAPEPEVQDTPTDAVDSAPVEDGTRADQPEEEIDWKKRAEDAQAWATRASQEASELREAQEQAEAEQAIVEALSDPEQQEQTFAYLVQELGQEEATAWAEAHGFEVDLEDEEGQEVRDPRVDTLLEKEARKEANEYAQRVEQEMETTFDKALGEHKLKRADLPEGLADVLLDAALARGMQSQGQDVNGMVEAVVNQWVAARKADLKAYRDSKRDNPTPPIPGSSGTPNPSLGDRDERLARANAVAEEALIQP